jgi:hypothetical protein
MDASRVLTSSPWLSHRWMRGPCRASLRVCVRGKMNERKGWKERDTRGTYHLLRWSMDASRVLTSLPWLSYWGYRGPCRASFMVCVRRKRWMRGRDGKREREREGHLTYLRGSFDWYSARGVHAELPIHYASYRRK